MTGKQMCETVAWVMLAAYGDEVDPEAIWNMDPRGELWPVCQAFEGACAWIDREFGLVSA